MIKKKYNHFLSIHEKCIIEAGKPLKVTSKNLDKPLKATAPKKKKGKKKKK